MSIGNAILALLGLSGEERAVVFCVRYTCIHNVALAIWLYGAWVPFVYEVFGRENSVIGWLSAANSVFELVGAAFGGHWGDRCGDKKRVIQAAMMMGIISMMFHVVGVTFRSLPLITVAQCLFGVFMGTSLTSVESWVADHVAPGSRDAVYGVKYSLEMSGPIVGCILSLLLFLFVGDTWSVSTLTFVVLFGLLVHTLGMGWLLLDVLHEEAQMHDETDTVSEVNEMDHTRDAAAPSHAICTVARWPWIRALIPAERVPTLVAAHDLVVVVGSGFTTMYFTLFMIQEYQISPVGMSLLQGACGLTTVAFVSWIGRFGAAIGRCPLVFAMRAVGFSCLVYIALCEASVFAPFVVMFCVYAVRFGAMNATTGATRSVLMDIVPVSQRARWNAVESLQSASWSGTSVLGGYVTDRFGYRAAFAVTCVFHLAGCLILLPTTTVDDRPAILYRESQPNEA